MYTYYYYPPVIKFIFIVFIRYIKEWAEYKKTDAYKEFRRQQMEQKESVGPTKKIKQNPALDQSVPNPGELELLNLKKISTEYLLQKGFIVVVTCF